MPKLLNPVHKLIRNRLKEIDAEIASKYEDYLKSIEPLDKERRELMAEIPNYSTTQKAAPKAPKVKQTRKRRAKREIDLSKYPQDGSLRNKMLYAVNDSNRFINMNQIAEYIIAHNKEKIDREVILTQLSGNMYKYADQGLIVAYKVDGNKRKTFYGDPKWLDESGEIKKGYEFDKSLLN